MVKTGDQCNRELADWLGLSPNGLGPKFSFTQMMVDDGWELVSHGYVFPTREIGRTNITMNLDVFHYRREAK